VDTGVVPRFITAPGCLLPDGSSRRFYSGPAFPISGISVTWSLTVRPHDRLHSVDANTVLSFVVKDEINLMPEMSVEQAGVGDERQIVDTGTIAHAGCDFMAANWMLLGT